MCKKTSGCIAIVISILLALGIAIFISEIGVLPTLITGRVFLAFTFAYAMATLLIFVFTLDKHKQDYKNTCVCKCGIFLAYTAFLLILLGVVFAIFYDILFLVALELPAYIFIFIFSVTFFYSLFSLISYILCLVGNCKEPCEKEKKDCF